MSSLSIEDALERFEGDAALWAEFAETWLGTVQADRDGFLEAVASGNAESSLYHIHKLRGASDTIGAAELASIAQAIEAAIREARLDQALSLASAFESVYAESIIETRRYIEAYRRLP